MIVSIDVLLGAFKDNSVRAQDTYGGKLLRITAPVYMVGNNMFGGDRAAVVLQDVTQKGSFMPTHAEFWFEPSFRPQISQLSEGDLVTCEGVLIDQQFGGDLKFEGRSLTKN